MRFLDATAIERLLDPQTAYDSQREAFHCLGSGLADLAERLILAGTDGDALAFCYAARLRPGTPAVCKFGAVAPDNSRLGLPSVHAQILALHPRTGQLIAAFDGEAVTTLRTPAATAVAVDHLAAPGPRTLAVLGCGVQGRAHVRALAGRVSRVLLWDHRPGRAAETADRLAPEVPVPVSAAPSAAAAVGAAEIVVTCTTSSTPVLRGEWVTDGATVVSVGSFAPDRSEVDRALVRRAGAVVVDHVPTGLRQAGPVVGAVAAGDLAPDTLIGLGDVVANGRQARADRHTIVYYNSVGLGVQDAAAVNAMLAAQTRQEQV
ncbi:ornithine cyclodeaminase family protein [Micromonospora cathayae]|uniref:Ornithine cyclodeaminase family protein n=1 Tax=Micromonospora cathayae TaxID=3028804 RepID=A0ABY7ZPF9_9ACTN|nr:ornithine cyclodeaminase family protein [Micromonospora sp. HUAS 3]WDZ83834.1 ornithine cyclodeaminase family protein [Micromonospora sp. HUAS 3]